MQTFLPYSDFEKTVKCLDWRRLGKQRVESRQILNIILGASPNSRWRNHPAVLMWQGYAPVLSQYSDLCIKEWIARGYKNNMLILGIHGDFAKPIWLGDEEFHAAHRSNLLRKNSEYYSQFNWTEPNNLEYIWPVRRRRKDSKFLIHKCFVQKYNLPTESNSVEI